MPYVSQKQDAFFHSPGAAKAGITPADVAKWDAESKGLNLPERAPQAKRRSKKVASAKPKARSRSLLAAKVPNVKKARKK